jgi:anti-anti-sigma regulatory factor
MTISRISHTDPAVVAFTFSGSLSRTDVVTMAEVLNAAFDNQDAIKVLLDFRALVHIEADAMASFSATRAQLRSLVNVSRYAVIDPPEAAGKMIRLADKIIPVDAEVFAAEDSESAWYFIEQS